MNTWEEFDREAKTVEKATKEQAPECVKLLQDAVGLFADALVIAAEKPGATDAIVAKMSLLSHNFNTLKCSVDLALRGYYNQSVNLLRIVYENCIAFHYLGKYPNKAHLWLRASKKKKPPSHAAMLNALDKKFNPLKGQMRKLYSTLCSFAHTDAIGVLPQISTDFSPGEISIHFGATYNDDLFRAPAYFICLCTGVMLSDISQWVPKTNEWHNKLVNTEKSIIEFIDEENKKFKSETT